MQTLSFITTIHSLAAIFFSDTDDCTTTSSLDCRLHSFLSFLYIAAAVLTVILILVAAIALATYLKNKSNMNDQP